MIRPAFGGGLFPYRGLNVGDPLDVPGLQQVTTHGHCYSYTTNLNE